MPCMGSWRCVWTDSRGRWCCSSSGSASPTFVARTSSTGSSRTPGLTCLRRMRVMITISGQRSPSSWRRSSPVPWLWPQVLSQNQVGKVFLFYFLMDDIVRLSIVNEISRFNVLVHSPFHCLLLVLSCYYLFICLSVLSVQQSSSSSFWCKSKQRNGAV